jgi:hypothetical protein
MTKIQIDKKYLNIIDNCLKIMGQDETFFIIKPNGIDVRIIDPSHVTMLIIQNIPYNFKQYEMDFSYCKTNPSAKEDYQELKRYSNLYPKLLNNIDSMIELEWDKNTLIISSEDCNNSIKYFDYCSPTVTTPISAIIPNLQLESENIIDTKTFIKLINLYNIFPNIELKQKDNKLFIGVNQNNIKSKCLLGYNNNKDTKDSESLYPMEYLIMFKKLLQLIKSKDFEINFNTDFPLKFIINLELIKIECYIAPRIEND